jgi:tripartite-type tricarboxylate transporter receptor subunit TctC
MSNTQACGQARRQFLCLAGATALSAGVLQDAHAQGGYPNKPIRIIVPFPAGGGGDSLARLVLSKAATVLGQPVVFDNIGGAGGNIGSGAAARSEPNGYTTLYGTNGTFGINHTLYPKTGFDPVKDFVPVTRLTEIPLVLAVRDGAPFKTIADLIKEAKSHPGKITFASAGSGTTGHLVVEMLKSQLGLHMLHIPYRGGAPGLTALLGGEVDFMFDVTASLAPQVKSGRLKALAVSTRERLPAMSDVPTLAESVAPGFHVTAWDGLFVPMGTPTDVISVLLKAIQSALVDRETQNALALRGATPNPLSGEDFSRFVRNEIERWGKVVKNSGATLN